MNPSNPHHNEIVQKHDQLIEFHTSVIDRPRDVVIETDSGFAGIEAENLAAFTGYYLMKIEENESCSGAYLAVDTTYSTLHFGDGVERLAATVTVSISLDGKTVSTFKDAKEFSFIDDVLTIPDEHLRITFRRSSQVGQGILNTFVGTAGEARVYGHTRFNPVPLSTFVGSYKVSIPKQSSLYGEEILTISAGDTPEVKFLFPFEQKGDKELDRINSYSYNPSTFVLTFQHRKIDYILMLGTSGLHGLACSISSEFGAVLVESIISSS